VQVPAEPALIAEAHAAPEYHLLRAARCPRHGATDGRPAEMRSPYYDADSPRQSGTLGDLLVILACVLPVILVVLAAVVWAHPGAGLMPIVFTVVGWTYILLVCAGVAALQRTWPRRLATLVLLLGLAYLQRFTPPDWIDTLRP
jgi:hypothetical protein